MQLAPYKVVGGSLGLGGITILLAPLDFYPLAVAMGAVGLGLIVGVANRAEENAGLPTLALALALCLGSVGVGLYGFNKAQDRDESTLIDPGPEAPAAVPTGGVPPGAAFPGAGVPPTPNVPDGSPPDAVPPGGNQPPPEEPSK